MKNYVIDTNSLLKIISRKGGFYIAWKKFHNEEYCICVTTEILLEYEEKIALMTTKEIAENVVKQIAFASNVVKSNPQFKTNFISDADDNKFVDCAIQTNAEYIVSDDSDYNDLQKIKFPKIIVRKLAEFVEDLKKGNHKK